MLRGASLGDAIRSAGDPPPIRVEERRNCFCHALYVVRNGVVSRAVPHDGADAQTGVPELYLQSSMGCRTLSERPSESYDLRFAHQLAVITL